MRVGKHLTNVGKHLTPDHATLGVTRREEVFNFMYLEKTLEICSFMTLSNFRRNSHGVPRGRPRVMSVACYDVNYVYSLCI